MDKRKLAALIHRVDETLYYLWDPIGVVGNPRARDEYSSYAPKIAKMLIEGRDSYKLSSHLGELAASSMGVSRQLENNEAVVHTLLEWKEAIEDGYT